MAAFALDFTGAMREDFQRSESLQEYGMDTEIKDRFDQFIQSRGLRRTAQRDEILRVIFTRDEHFNAEELVERVRSCSSDASRATIYRTLSLLVEANLLREIDLGDSLTTYDPNFIDRPSHNHLVCIDCGQVIEFEDSNLELLNECVTRRLGFQARRQSIKIEANCEKLRLSGRCERLIQTRLTGRRLKKKR